MRSKRCHPPQEYLDELMTCHSRVVFRGEKANYQTVWNAMVINRLGRADGFARELEWAGCKHSGMRCLHCCVDDGLVPLRESHDERGYVRLERVE